MIIKSIEVKNFRSIREQSLDFDDLTVLVGRNGSGKSSLLYAIETFYNVAAPLTKEDFFERDISSTIEIRVTFGDLREDEEEEFRPYIKDNKLIVTKRITSENDRIIQRYYAATLQIPEFAEIRTLSGKRERVSFWNELIDKGKFIDLNKKVRSSDEVERLSYEYEIKHPELTKPIEKEEQFFGPKNIGGGKLDKFTKFVLVPAVREASDEAMSRKGAIYQILDMIVLRKVNERKDIQEFKLELEKKVKEIYCSKNLTELPELGVSISETLAKFAPGSQLKLKWDEIKPPEVQLPTAIATLIEDNFEGEISRKGHGLQRALILTLLQHLAMAVPPELPSIESIKENNALGSISTESIRGPDLILAIEEPELYLHPSRCRYLSDILLKLSEKLGVGLGARNQIIYSTHSPYFIDIHRFDQIRIARKILSPDSTVLQSAFTCFTLKEATEELVKMFATKPANFTREALRARAMSVINTIINEGFFADVVVVVEGLSEVGILWKLQDIMSKNWSQLGITIVPAGGKNNIGLPTIIFLGFKIPTYFIFDSDSHLSDINKREKAKECNRRYLRLAGAMIEDFPNTQVHEVWAVFKDNLEKDISNEMGNEEFISIRDLVADELGYDNPNRVLKNIEGSARFVECIYNKGKQLPTLEKIINAVTQLAQGGGKDN